MTKVVFISTNSMMNEDDIRKIEEHYNSITPSDVKVVVLDAGSSVVGVVECTADVVTHAAA